MIDLEERRCDVLVVGTGAAGCLAAIEAADNDAEVVLTSKGALGRTGTTNVATVEMAAAIGHGDEEDSPWSHFTDTVIGSRYLANQELAHILCFDSPSMVYYLDSLGMPWDKLPDGRYWQRPMPGMSYRRGVCYDAKTGKMLQGVLAHAVQQRPTIHVLNDFLVFRLLKSTDGQIAGVVGWQSAVGRLLLIRARTVILATGGAGRLYKICGMDTGATGDGMAMAYFAGAELQDMEFHQIFPTGFVWPECIKGMGVASSVLWSKGLRLYNALGDRFMERYDPARLENVPRDQLTWAIYSEIREGRGTEHGGVWLDTHAVENWQAVKTEFAKAYARPQSLGIDTRRMEVGPYYHYTMGGIRFSVDGETTILGLFAAGEAGGGLHGANRLGGNALSECAVFGVRAGRAAARRKGTLPDIDPAEKSEAVEYFYRVLDRKGPGRLPRDIRTDLAEMMNKYVWVLRAADGLSRALESLGELRSEANVATVTPEPRHHPSLFDALELDLMLVLAEPIVRSALLRTESRGSHQREDFPQADDEKWLCNIVVWRNAHGDAQHRLDPVRFTHCTPPALEKSSAWVTP